MSIDVEIELLRSKGYYIAFLDGEKCLDLRAFITQIGRAFHFPDYYGNNMDALDECINDLDWISEKNYALVVINSNSFLSSETTAQQNSIWGFFEKVKVEWVSVPNFEGEDQFRSKADFIIIKR